MSEYNFTRLQAGDTMVRLFAGRTKGLACVYRLIGAFWCGYRDIEGSRTRIQAIEKRLLELGFTEEEGEATPEQKEFIQTLIES